MFSEKLKELRKGAGFGSQAKLADHLGVSQQAVGMWEAERNMPDYGTLKKIASTFGVSTDYLLDYEKEPIDAQAVTMSIEIKKKPGLRAVFDAIRGLDEGRLSQVGEYAAYLGSKQKKAPAVTHGAVQAFA